MPLQFLPGLVWYPFLIYIFIKTRQNSHDFTTPGAHHNIGAHSIQYINGLCLPADTSVKHINKTGTNRTT